MSSDSSYPTMTIEEWDNLLENWEKHPGCERCPLLFSGIDEKNEEWEECFLLRNTDWDGVSFPEVCCRVAMARINDFSPTTVKEVKELE